jgi:sulfur-oxidizing protein SoxY
MKAPAHSPRRQAAAAFACCVLAGLLAAGPAAAQSSAGGVRAATAQTTPDATRLDPSGDPEASPNWQKVRVSLFGSRPIDSRSTDVVALESPARAEDAAVVPIAIRARFDQSAGRYVEKLYLIVDRNPSPISAVFTLSPLSGRADIETRIRVEDYSFIRAVAELNDGSLHMSTRYIKASGGCSAPAGRDLARAMANLGRWKLRVEGEPEAGKPTLAQLMISHPNESGLAMDQLTRTYASPHFVREVEVRYDGQRLLSADIDFSISENPNFRFWFTPHAGPGELEVRFVDNKDLAFNGTVAVSGRPGSAAVDPR